MSEHTESTTMTENTTTKDGESFTDKHPDAPPWATELASKAAENKARIDQYEHRQEAKIAKIGTDLQKRLNANRETLNEIAAGHGLIDADTKDDSTEESESLEWEDLSEGAKFFMSEKEFNHVTSGGEDQ